MPPRLIIVAAAVFLTLLLDGISSQIVEDAVLREAAAKLTDSFDKLKEQGLRIRELKREYEASDITYTSIGDIPAKLLSSMGQSRVRSVLDVMDAVISEVGVANGQTIQDCCDTSSSELCCYGCTAPAPSDVMSAAHSINNGGLDESVEMRVGFTNGDLLVHPATPTQGTCTEIDARLTAWFNTVTEAKPREIVIFLDLNEQGIMGNSSRAELRDVAIKVVRSLGTMDKVGLVLVTDNNQGACPIGSTLGVASEQLKEQLITTIQELGGLFNNRNYRVDFTAADKYFTTDSNTDKLLLMITDGRVLLTNDEVTDFQTEVNLILSTMNYEFLMYTAHTPVTNDFLNYLQSFTTDTMFNPLSDIPAYASVLSQTDTPSDTYHVTTQYNRDNELSLSISRVWTSNDTVVGVVNAMLPWRYLMEEVVNLTVVRPSSYYFLLNQNGDLLYHQLFDNINVVSLEAGLFENEDVFTNDLLPAVTSGSKVDRLAVDKTMVTNYEGVASYINRVVPSAYFCQVVITIDNATQVNEGLIHVCVVVATEDLSTVESFNVADVAGVYRNSPSRLPVYNTLLSDLSPSDSCNAFCIPSIEDRFSVQLTTPITPPTDEDSITSYISGAGPRPAGIEGNIAEELSIVSVAGQHWVTSSGVATSIKRRHLATPTGIYLGYPAVELNITFVPRYLPWYVGAVTNRDHTLLLTRSNTDQLDRVGVVYSASYPITNDGVLLSVVAADVTESSLRISVQEALNNTLCGETGYDCMVVNSLGEFVLHPSGYPDDDNLLEVEEYSGIVTSLLMEGILVKEGCNIVTPVGTGHRVYYKLSSLSSSLCVTTSRGCFDYCITPINGTDSFLLIIKRKETCEAASFRFCNDVCVDCNELNANSVECRCQCAVETCSTTVDNLDIPTCPAQNTPPSYYHVDSAPTSVDIVPCNENRCCGYEESECQLSPSCNWCADQSACMPLGSCCSGDTDCCSGDAQLLCILQYCSSGRGNEVCSIAASPTPVFTPTPSESPSNVNRQAAIIGGVVGGVFGIALLALLIVCCVWYQLCKAPENAQSKEHGDFNFTDIKVSSTNKTAVELKGVEPLPEEEEPVKLPLPPSSEVEV